MRVKFMRRWDVAIIALIIAIGAIAVNAAYRHEAEARDQIVRKWLHDEAADIEEAARDLNAFVELVVRIADAAMRAPDADLAAAQQAFANAVQAWPEGMRGSVRYFAVESGPVTLRWGVRPQDGALFERRIGPWRAMLAVDVGRLATEALRHAPDVGIHLGLRDGRGRWLFVRAAGGVPIAQVKEALAQSAFRETIRTPLGRFAVIAAPSRRFARAHPFVLTAETAGGALVTLLLVGAIVRLVRREMRLARVNARLHEQRKRIARAMLDALPTPVSFLDRGAHYLEFNRAHAEWVGRSFRELKGRHVAEIWDEKAWREEIEPAFAQALEGRPYEREFRYRDRDWLALFAPWRSERGVEGVIVVTRDITAQKQAEAERMQKLAAQMRAQRWEDLGMIAGGVAHDLNNLLAIVLGQADHILEQHPELKPEIAPIAEAAEKGGALCRGLLAFAGKGGQERRRVHPQEVLEGTLLLLRASLPSQARLEARIPRRMPLLHADPVQLRQAVFNIAHNAIQAVSERGGLVEISAAAVDGKGLDWAAHQQPPAPQAVVFTIRDDGPGIPPELQEKIFTPFFTTKAEGTGLGLAVAEGIVRAHGGWIELESSPGKGTVFRLVVPALDAWAEPEAQAAETEAAPSSIGRGRTALVADDEPLVRRLTAQALKRMGFAVIEAEDGAEALEKLRAHPEIELAVLDVHMPKMTGLEALEAIRRERPAVKTIVLSGYAEDRKQSPVQPDAWLMKPIRRKALEETVAEVLGG